MKQRSQTEHTERDTLIHETAQADEATILERLRALLQSSRQESLVGLLDRIPAAKLTLILRESSKHRFLDLDQLLQHLTLRRAAELLGQTPADEQAGVFGRPGLLARVRATLGEVDHPEHALLLSDQGRPLLALAYGADCPPREGQRLGTLVARGIDRGETGLLDLLLAAADLPPSALEGLEPRHLSWLWGRRGAAMRRMAGRHPGPHARRYLELVGEVEEEEARTVLSALLDHLDDEQAWQLVRDFVQRHCTCKRGWAFSFILGTLESDRTARIVSERYSDAEIGVYWPLFSEGVRRALSERGRGRVRSFGHTGQTGQPGGPRSERRRQRQHHARKKATRLRPEERRALRTMVEVYGFDATMSYHEAQRRYWRLAMQWHPDRAGGSPALERKIKDLNQAWDTGKRCFASNA